MKKVKPVVVYQYTVQIFDQRTIIEALGITLKDTEYANVYCDGSNKVRIEIHP